jgi:hypothetical protein
LNGAELCAAAASVRIVQNCRLRSGCLKTTAAPDTGTVFYRNQVKNFTNFSCEFGGRLLNNALNFEVSRTNFNW